MTGTPLNHEQDPAATGGNFLCGPKWNQYGIILFILAKKTGLALFQHPDNLKGIAAHAYLCAGDAVLLAGK